MQADRAKMRPMAAWRPIDRARLALALTGLIAVAAGGAVVAVGDPPVLRTRSVESGPSRAAVAIRDHVIPFQKWGTKMFTVPHLEESYDRVYYFTQRFRGDRKDELTSALEEALRKHDHVDLFLLAHGNHFIYWVEQIEPALRDKLRLVYNTGCGQSTQGNSWLAVGADAYVGHPSRRSVSPAFYYFFLRRWARGYSLADAVSAGNASASRRLGWLGLDDRPDIQATALLFGNDKLWVGGKP